MTTTFIKGATQAEFDALVNGSTIPAATHVHNLDDVAQGTSYTKLTAANATALTGSGSTTLHTHSLDNIADGMSYKKMASGDVDSLTGGVSTSVPHGHRATSRSTTVSDDIELTDENNIIDVGSGRTSDVVLSKTNIAATPNLQFKIRVEYHATYVAHVQYNATQYWILNGTTDSSITYVFSVDASGYCIPENDGLSLTPAA